VVPPPPAQAGAQKAAPAGQAGAASQPGAFPIGGAGGGKGSLTAANTPGHTVDPDGLGRILKDLACLSVADTDRVARVALTMLPPGARANILSQFGGVPPNSGGAIRPPGGGGGGGVGSKEPTTTVAGHGSVETRVFDAVLNRAVATSDEQTRFSDFQKAHPKAFAKGAPDPGQEVRDQHKTVAEALTKKRADVRAELLRGERWTDVDLPVFTGLRATKWVKTGEDGYYNPFTK
jgi:hypothetical protein